VIAIGEELAAPPEHPVETPGQPDLEAEHPAREAGRPLGLDDEVDVVALDAELHDAEEVAVAAREDRPSNHAHGSKPPERPHLGDDAQRDVLRMT
jgi:hypothetical protein